jgi:hypothetical protein
MKKLTQYTVKIDQRRESFGGREYSDGEAVFNVLAENWRDARKQALSEFSKQFKRRYVPGRGEVFSKGKPCACW